MVLGRDRDELLAGLDALATAGQHPGLVAPGTPAAASEPGPVLVFPGQGSQWPGMGAKLLDTSPVFAARIAECEQALAPHIDWSLTDVLRGTEGAADLNRVDVVQPVLWATMVSLAAVWADHGVTPAAVIGHSQGEIAAACIAGALTLTDAATITALRSKALRNLAGHGAMASLGTGRDGAERLLEERGGDVVVAAFNGPSSTVVSGPPEAVADVVAAAKAAGLRARMIDVDYASHGPQIDRITGELHEVLAGIRPFDAEIPFYSTVHAGRIDTTGLDAAYWVTNLREQVRFADTVEALLNDGHRVFIEASAHPVLTVGLEEIFEEAGADAYAVPTLHRDRGDRAQVARSVAEAFTAGVQVDWTALFGRTARRRAVDLPTYAFQRRPYWLAPAVPSGGGGPGHDQAETELWNAIEELDVDALGAALHLDGDGPALDDLRPALPILSEWRRRHREQSTLDSWRYQIGWTHLPEIAAPVLSGTWLVLVPADGGAGAAERSAIDTAVQAIRSHGATASVLPVDCAAVERDQLVQHLTEAETPPSGILSLLALDETPHPSHPAVPAGLAATTALVQALDASGIAVRLWCVTQGAVAVSPSDPLLNPVQAETWGLGRVAALEYPARWGGLIDLPTTPDQHTPARLAALLTPGQPEDQVAVRATATLARRMRRAPAPSGNGRAPWTPSGTTLITGGTGGLGAHLARWLAHNGAPHLLLTSRRGPDAPGARELADELRALGTAVTLTACDVSDRSALKGVIDGVPDDQPLNAVFHAAGIPELHPFAELDIPHISDVLLPKAQAAAHLHELTRHLDLTAFVLFSSGAAAWGSGQQASYAAANTYLDALAEHRRTLGLPATSIAWGPWGEAGMAADENVIAFFARRGLAIMDPDLAVKSLHQAVSHGDTTLTVADIHWETFTATFTTQRPSRLVADLTPSRSDTGDGTGGGAGAEEGRTDDHPLRGELAGSTPKQQLELLVRHVQEHAATILGHSGADAVSAGQPLQELGFDSLTAVELSKRLGSATGLSLPRTLVFDHPTPNAIAKYLRAELTGQQADAVRSPASITSAATDEPIAIVAMACRFPGGVRNPQQLWDLVASGGDAIAEMPTNRSWDLDNLYHPDPEHPGTSYVREGAFLYDAPEFDAGFFGISPREALAMDPQQRLLLETAWETFENAGLTQEALSGSNVGVFTGGTFQGYSATGTPAKEIEGYILVGNTASVMSGRVSYTFGLEGPAVTVDTACSSSLVAIHLASQALAQGECDLALAGGVTVMATPATFIGFSRQRGLAPNGRCKPFAAAADGTGWGEGAGLLLLERLSDAERNGHHILATIRGSAVNQDGTSNGLTAPNGPSQQRVIRQALANARLEPADVDAVEAHGTGTTLGDPIEAQALLATYGRNRPEDRPLWLGSIKSNIGHTQMAAGVAGVIKMVMAMRNGLLPESLHIDEPSPHVDWEAGAVRLLSEPVEWVWGGRPRRAGVSSFGISGTNAHLIVEQAPEPDPEVVPEAESESEARVGSGGVVPWVVSARSVAGLRDQAAALSAHLSGRDVSPVQVGWSLATRRSVFEHRAVITGHHSEEFLQGLDALAAGDDHPCLTASPSAGATGGEVVWMFSGQGSQRPGMGAGLYERFPVFATTFDQICDLLDPHLPHPLRDVVFNPDPDQPDLLDHTLYTQTALFALQVSLARLLNQHGHTPHTLIGHSIGEIAAAHIAGILDLPDACRLLTARATLMDQIPIDGTMTAIQATYDELTDHLQTVDPDGRRIAIAALNTPDSTVVSGDPDLVAQVADVWAGKGRKTRRLKVSHAFHSPHMDPVLEPFAEVVRGLTHRPATIPLITNLTGGPVEDLGPDYWIQQVRQPVRFQPAIEYLARSATPPAAYLELGPDPVLAAAARHTLASVGGDGRPEPVVAATLNHRHSDVHALTDALAQLHTHVAPIDWSPYFPSRRAGSAPDLPNYAFQRRSYWLVNEPEKAAATENALDSEFWDAVEREDVESLARTLGSPAEQETSLGEVLPILSGWRRRHREQGVLDSYRYQVAWTHLPEESAPVLSGTWLVLVPANDAEGPAADLAVQALRAHGAVPNVLRVEATTAGREEFARQLADADADAPLEGVLSLLALDETPHPSHPAVPAGLAATTALVQALDDSGVPARLWCLTQGAVSVSPSDPLLNPLQAETWGLGRVAALEYPARWGGLIDLPTTPDQHTPARLAALLAPGQPEDQAAIRATAVLARRMRRAPDRTNGDAPWRPSGTTLITGGTGGLGAHLARWLAHNGAPHLLLTSRRGPDAPGARELAEELQTLGTAVTLTACDVSDRSALKNVIDGVPGDQPLNAVFHVAGIPELTAFADLDVPHIGEVLRSKALAADHLHELTRDLDLTAFVLFSSGAAAWGSGQQASYAAANAYLDALAEHRHTLGLPATSIAWGPWAQAGMAAVDDVITYIGRRGLTPLDPDLALKALHRALTRGETTLTVADIEWEAFTTTFTTQRPSPLIADLAPARPDAAADVEEAAEGGGHPLREQLAGGTPEEQRHILLRHVQARVAAVLGHPDPDAIPAAQPFQELGFDSLSAVELRNRLAATTGLPLPPTLIFDHPSCGALADLLRVQLLDVDVVDEGRVLSGLDQWDSSCDPAAVDGAARRRVTQRLESLLAKWNATGDEDGRSAPDHELETATAEDIFDLIADEFGKS
ncbi:type I polyketide synthase [Actinomadura yumaensis]